jgi:hypothetical protein
MTDKIYGKAGIVPFRSGEAVLFRGRQLMPSSNFSITGRNISALFVADKKTPNMPLKTGMATFFI